MMYILRLNRTFKLMEVKMPTQTARSMLLLKHHARLVPPQLLTSVSQAVSAKMAPPVLPAPKYKPPLQPKIYSLVAL